MKRIAATALAAAICVAGANKAHAQMGAFEQSIDRLRNNLPAATFDGRTLKVSTYKELVSVSSYVRNYKSNLQKAINAWKRLGRGKTTARRNKLVERQAYFKGLHAAFSRKAKQIKPPAQGDNRRSRRRSKRRRRGDVAPDVAPGEIYVGPDVNKDTPILIDTIGDEDTLFRAWGSPGTKSKPSRWTAKLWFHVRYKDIAADDVVMIQVMKGRKKLGPATPCAPKGLRRDAQLAYFECKSPVSRDWEKLHKTDGAHTIKLTYKKPIAGTSFKDFAALQVQVKKLKQGASNNPYAAWGTIHDMKLTVSTIAERGGSNSGGRGWKGVIAKELTGAYRGAGSTAVIRTWFKRTKSITGTKITCMYKGKRVAEAREAGGRTYKYWSFKRKGSRARDDAMWVQTRYRLHDLHPRGEGGGNRRFSRPQHWMSENPGEYRCVITGSGEVLKELFFTVGSDGEIVKPGCQLESMNALRHITLLTASDKVLSDRAYDKALGKKRGFEGRVTWARGCPPRK